MKSPSPPSGSRLSGYPLWAGRDQLREHLHWKKETGSLGKRGMVPGFYNGNLGFLLMIFRFVDGNYPFIDDFPCDNMQCSIAVFAYNRVGGTNGPFHSQKATTSINQQPPPRISCLGTLHPHAMGFRLFVLLDTQALENIRHLDVLRAQWRTQ